MFFARGLRSARWACDRPRGRARADTPLVFAAVRNRVDGCRVLRGSDRGHLAAAALASYLPARRASAIDPVETLKAE